MAEYMLLIVGQDEAYQALDEQVAKEMYQGHFAFMDALKSAGVQILASAELEPPDSARTVHSDGTVTDGPFAETKEQVGGFYTIDVPSIEEAVEWAKRIPLLPTDLIEVRPAK
jgi:hypothetical protein